MITHVHTRRGSGNPDSPRFGPDETEVRWDCDGPCGMVGLEWGDQPHGSDGSPLDAANEGDDAYCGDCAKLCDTLLTPAEIQQIQRWTDSSIPEFADDMEEDIRKAAGFIEQLLEERVAILRLLPQDKLAAIKAMVGDE